MFNLELARSMQQERMHEIEAEYRWRSVRAQMREQRPERNGTRTSMLRRLASVFVTFSVLRSR